MNTNKRLLIADDDDQIRELLVFDIQSSGYIAEKLHLKKHWRITMTLFFLML